MLVTDFRGYPGSTNFPVWLSRVLDALSEYDHASYATNRSS
jgi:hypothetical protein